MVAVPSWSGRNNYDDLVLAIRADSRRPLMVGSELSRDALEIAALFVRRPLIVGSEQCRTLHAVITFTCHRPLMVGSERYRAPFMVWCNSRRRRPLMVGSELPARTSSAQHPLASPSPHGRVGTRTDHRDPRS